MLLIWRSSGKLNEGKFSPTLLKPETLNVSVSTCSNCKEQVTIPPGEQNFSCESYHGRTFTNKLGIEFLGNMNVKNNGETLSLIFFADAAPKSLNGNIHTYIEKPVELEDELFDMDGPIDITYTAGRKVITKFVLHDDN